MTFQSWEGFQEDYGERVGRAYTGVKEYTGAIAEGVGEMICNLHATYPDKWFIPAITRGFLNASCSGAGLPVPETNSFGDGQCIANYYITGEWKVTRRFQTGTFDVEEVLIGDPGILGAITDIVLVNDADGANVMDFQISTSSSETPILVRIDQRSGVGYVAGTINYRIERVDGEPDICLNQGGYPESPPVSSGDLTTNIITNTVNKAGDIISTTNISATYGGDTNVFGFPTTVNVGGDTVTVDFDGFSFGAPSGTGGGTGGGGEGEGTGTGGSNTTTYKSPFDGTDFVTTRPPNTDGGEPQTEEEAEEKEEEEEEVPEVTWVLVDVTTLPIRGKTIVHASENDLQCFAGWFCWTVSAPGGSYRLPEMPLRKKQNAFLSPQEANGYSVFAINGAKIKVTKYTPKPEE